MSSVIYRTLFATFVLIVSMSPLLHIWLTKQTSIRSYRKSHLQAKFQNNFCNGCSIIISEMDIFTLCNLITISPILAIMAFGIGEYPVAIFVFSIALWVPIAIRLTRNIHTLIAVTNETVFIYYGISNLCKEIGINIDTTAATVTYIGTRTLEINGRTVDHWIELANSDEIASAINTLAESKRSNHDN